MLMLSAPAVTEVPVEARAFLGAVAAFVVFLFVFFLYLNKKLCFYSVGGFPCCDENAPAKLGKDLGAAFKYDEKETSSDSENDASKQLSKSYSHQSMKQEDLYQKQNGFQSYQACQHNYHQLGPSKSPSQYSNKDSVQNDSLGKSPIEGAARDLISLAEKGRVCVDEISGNAAPSSSSASSSGSTTSGDDDLMTHRTLRHRDPRAYRQLSPSRSPYQVGFIPEDLLGISEEVLLAKCGSIEASFSYDLPTRMLTAHILQAKDVPEKERGGGIINSQIRLLLLPTRKQKQKTKIRRGENPQFNECFVFNKINPEDVMQLGIRIRLYGVERMRRERVIGETIVPLSTVNMSMGNFIWINLEPRSSTALNVEERVEVCSLPRSDSTGSNHSVHGGLPELLLGLAYNGTTGRLAVEVVKGSHFRHTEDYRNLGNSRAPDTYVKLILTSSSGQEIASSKTSVRRGQPSPLFKETFMFQVALFQLPDVTLMLSVYTKRSMNRKENIGWFSLGLNSSGEEELNHWNAMRDSRGEQISRWHVLHDA